MKREDEVQERGQVEEKVWVPSQSRGGEKAGSAAQAQDYRPGSGCWGPLNSGLSRAVQEGHTDI